MLSTPDIPATEVRSQLEKNSAGPELENSPRLVELLNYIGEEFLAGRADRIKGFTIGQAIYAGDLDFDPESNSIVRVEMGRLRRRVAQYVNGDFSGAAESIEKNLARRGPTGPHMDVFLAAAYAQMGKNFEAQAVIEKLQRTNPDYPAKNWLGSFIQSENELQATMSKLYSLGLSRS